MDVKDFDYDLPEELIAQDPLEDRSSSRLMVLDKKTGEVSHQVFNEIVKYFFGIGTQEMTLEEIGEYFALTRERVRQIKEKAIRRLRNSTRSKLLKNYLG